MPHKLARLVGATSMSLLLAFSPLLAYAAEAGGAPTIEGEQQEEVREGEEQTVGGEQARVEQANAQDEAAAMGQATAGQASGDETAAEGQAAAGQASGDEAAAEGRATSGQASGDEKKAEPEATVSQQASGGDVEDIVSRMTLDEKISQMIIVSSRAWDGTDVTDLSAAPHLAEALRKHQYGGFIIYGSNVRTNEQVANLVQQLQNNNMEAQGVSTFIPYFIAADEEGGIVTRLTNGTRMTGSMAVGATPDRAANARTTGLVIGSELNALGLNVNFAPSLDVNSNPANPTIGTRAFSDDPGMVSELGSAWIEGHAETSTIATLKHFPGHGDTDTDTHIGTASVNKTKEQLEACELVPFRSAISYGADMIMTAHITLPKYDDEQQFADGSKGFYPATMSHKVITELLRGEMGYDGVVITDALEMDAIEKVKEAMVGGDGIVEQRANIAEKVINAGCDILLMPTDFTKQDSAEFYDAYIAAVSAKVGDGKPISMARIDESVTRILKLKEKYGFLHEPTPAGDISSVGSSEHHDQEMAVAREAITLVKNDGYTLPTSGHNNSVVLIGRTQGDNVALDYAVKNLQSTGLIAEDAFVNNLAAGTQRGDASSSTKITIDYTFDLSKQAVHYTDELKQAIAEANVVGAVAKTYALSALKKGAPQYEAIRGPLDDTHRAGGKFVFISDNLPYDAARYQDADAILLAYMGTGTDIDPTSQASGGANVGAFNANLVAAVGAMFDDPSVVGTLPVEIPAIVEDRDGVLHYSSEVLYERDFGLEYTYVFTEGAGGKHTKGTADSLTFKNNARCDFLASVSVDGSVIEPPKYEVTMGSTVIELSADYLNTLTAGEHTLSATYDYGAPLSAQRVVETQFRIDEQPKPEPGPEPEPGPTPAPEPEPVPKPEPDAHVKYLGHVQGEGWQTWKADGALAGTEGKSKRLESLMVQLADAPYEGSIEYRAHVQRDGWQKYVADGVPCGTEGQSKRMEAIQIRLTGKMSKHYVVWYRAHVQSIGWMGWAKNNEPSGTAGFGKRVEAVEIHVLPKSSDAPGTRGDAFRLAASYSAHVQGTGWQDAVFGGAVSGTVGESKRLEALTLQAGGSPYKGSIEYRVHVQQVGWMDYVADGAMAGTTGESKRVEAIQIRLTGKLAQKFDVRYRAHVQGIGWMDWVTNDEVAGTEGQSKRMEAVQVELVPKG